MVKQRNGLVIGDSKTKIGLILNQRDIRITRKQSIRNRGVAAIINYQHIEILEGLIYEFFQALGQNILWVPINHN